MSQQASTVPLAPLRAELSHEHRPLHALTGIRAFAACWVVLFHFRGSIVGLFPGLEFLSPLMGGGYLGVDLFFGLSGFILAYNYLHKLGSNGTWSDRARFLWLRLARVWPVHFFTLNIALLMWLVARGKGLATHSHLWESFTPLGYLQNLSLTHIWFGEDVSFNYPSWSVSAEWFAYLLFPLLALVVIKVRTLWGAWLGAMACYAVLGAVSYVDVLGVTGGVGMRVGLEFLAGCFLFRVWERTSRRMSWRYLVPASACGIVVGAVSIGATSHGVLLAPLFGMLILGLAKGQGFGVQALSIPVMTFAGEASYALYMTHALVQEVAVKLLPVERFIGAGWAVRAAVLAGYVIMVAGAAVLTYLCVEKPARHRLRSVRAFATPRPSKRADIS